jgi:uncharacterized protein YndB with AHSA1/START domain
VADMHHYIFTSAPASEVHRLITTQDGLKAWWTVDTEATPELGSVARFGFDRRTTMFAMRIEELEPEHLKWTCIEGPEEWKGTELTFDLDPDPDGTGIIFTHAKWQSIEGMFAMCNTTWGELMHRLRDAAEGKKPGPHFKK